MSRKSKILEYFNKFPKPYRNQAIFNLENFPIDKDEYFYFEINTIKDSLGKGFTWSQTPEGSDYWSIFYYSLI